MTVHIVRGDARKLPLADATVDLIVTSPPYWSLRAYTDGGEAYDGQIGSEDTPAEFIDNLIACTREWMRVLKPTGSLFVNLGDKYANPGPSGNTGKVMGRDNRHAYGGISTLGHGIKQKSLLGLPWRYALLCIDTTAGVPVAVVRQILGDVEAGLMTFADARTLVGEYDHGGGNAGLGLILRAEVIWSKPNGLPESVTDRTRRSHEQWFHLVRQPRYYSAIDHIRTPHAGPILPSGHRNPRYGRPGGRLPSELRGDVGTSRTPTGEYTKSGAALNPLGALPGSVWEVPTEPLIVPKHLGIDHFAAFPCEFPRRIILGWSPSGICTACGEGRRPVADRSEKVLNRPGGAARVGTGMAAASRSERERRNCGNVSTVHRIIGEVCGCPDTTAPTRPALVLDPFSGTGTTSLVANALGRDAIGVDMSADYCRLARWRTSDPGQIAKVLGVAKPPVQLAGQTDLLAELDGGAA